MAGTFMSVSLSFRPDFRPGCSFGVNAPAASLEPLHVGPEILHLVVLEAPVTGHLDPLPPDEIGGQGIPRETRYGSLPDPRDEFLLPAHHVPEVRSVPARDEPGERSGIGKTPGSARAVAGETAPVP